ncbi:MAG TPA: cobalamin-binding protein [Gammaproteobacteria bacterium]|jgi:iron complex transport system substrate-binding protein|nr:cobalamin-binding protein [Gammaproteobacteria bacterium]HET7586510.1 cobalamin-binding protein [Gammaproteobacteria bacterium]
MRRTLEFAVAVLLAGAAAVGAAAPAPRIVSLSPGLTELVYAAGAGEQLVGTTAYTDYPAAATRLPQIGDAFHIDVERLVALKPDLVLAWASADPPALLARLRGLGFKVAVFEPRTLADIAANLRRIGKLAGTSAEAEQAAQAVEQGLKRLREQYAGREPVRVFYEISAHPLYTINGKQIISQGIELCGGRNIFADLPSLAAPVSVAAVIARNPEAIVTGGDGNGNGVKNRLDAWRRWPQVTAVTNNALFSVPADQIARATPRMLEGIKTICRDLEKARQSMRSAPLSGQH